MPQIRAKNTFGKFMHGSDVVFKFKVDSDPRKTLPKKIIDSFPGKFNFYSLEDGFNFDFTVSHEYFDAFGGVFLASLINKSVGLEEVPESFVGEHKKCGYINMTANNTYAKKVNLTFTQDFILRSYPLYSEFGFDSISLPVQLEDISGLNESSMTGNSFVIITLKLDDIERIAQLSKTEWKDTLVKQATKTFNIIAKKPSIVKPLKNSVLVSGVGPIDRYDWSKGLNGKNFIMIPTPVEDSSLNVLMWNTREYSTFTSAYFKNKRSEQISKKLYQVWEGLLNE